MVGGIMWFSCVTIIKLTLSWTKSSELEKISVIPLVTWDHCLQFIKTMVWKHQLNGQKGKTKYQYEGGKYTSTLCFGKPYWLFATPGIKQVILVSITEECDEYFGALKLFCAHIHLLALWSICFYYRRLLMIEKLRHDDFRGSTWRSLASDPSYPSLESFLLLQLLLPSSTSDLQLTENVCQGGCYGHRK